MKMIDVFVKIKGPVEKNIQILCETRPIRFDNVVQKLGKLVRKSLLSY